MGLWLILNMISEPPSRLRCLKLTLRLLRASPRVLMRWGSLVALYTTVVGTELRSELVRAESGSVNIVVKIFLNLAANVRSEYT